MHKHQWETIRPENAKHKEGNKHLSYEILQICECGAYRLKEFLHIEDLENKGDAK